MSRRKGFFARLRRSLRWVLRIFLVLLIVDLLYLAMIWPDWKKLAQGEIPKSSFMQLYAEKQAERDWPKLRWQPVAQTQIPRHMLRAVLLAEDSRFYSHSGFDLVAIREALDYNFGRGELLIGASTISQQTVKNLYLSPSRDPLRKWHEVVLTFGLEQNLRKSRILELYLNVTEFGRGIYGVQAAAQAYYGVDVGALSLVQAAELAASLPSPVKNNPTTRTERFQKRSQRILDLLMREQSATATEGGRFGLLPSRGITPSMEGRSAGAVFRPMYQDVQGPRTRERPPAPSAGVISTALYQSHPRH
jgi:monofunctional biosynthetic peptidoglycan transglycosylase